MNKLTQQEAKDLVEQAWEEVFRHNLGSYRFGQVLWSLIPDELHSSVFTDTEEILGWTKKVSADFYYEPDSNIATEKFYKYFVEGNDDHI